METMKRKWGKPVTEVQRFVSQFCQSPCELVPGVKLYWAMSQEQNIGYTGYSYDDLRGRQATEQATTAGYLYMNPDTDVQFITSSTYPHDENVNPGYYQFDVTSYQFYKKEGNKYVKTDNPFLGNSQARDFVKLYNTFYRQNLFTEGTDVVIDETSKNVS